MRRSFAIVLAIVCGAIAVPAAAQAAKTTPGATGTAPEIGPRSGLPLPRFASLKTDKANLRHGPGKEHSVKWVYVRRDLPLEILEEYDTWRHVRDIDGATGWVAVSMLSQRRTAMVRPVVGLSTASAWSLRRTPSPEGKTVAYLEPGVIARIRKCPGAWCEVKAGRIGGWIERSALWGLYPGETVD